MSRKGKRAPGTALISYNAPLSERKELLAIAAELYPGEKRALSMLMRRIHREFIESERLRVKSGAAKTLPIIPMSRGETG